MKEKLQIDGFDSLVNGVVSLKDKYKKLYLVISWLSLTLSFVSVVIAIISIIIVYEWKYGEGEIEPLKPSGYFVVRGINYYKHPSDHLVLPIEWLNSGGKDVVISNISIELIDTNNNLKKYSFGLAGKYGDSFFNNYGAYEIRKNIILKPHSISPTILIFHIDGWWNKDDLKKHEFRFEPGEKYDVIIIFKKDLNGEPTKTPLFKDMTILPSIQYLQVYGKDGKPFWDYWDRESW